MSKDGYENREVMYASLLWEGMCTISHKRNERAKQRVLDLDLHVTTDTVTDVQECYDRHHERRLCDDWPLKRRESIADRQGWIHATNSERRVGGARCVPDHRQGERPRVCQQVKSVCVKKHT